MLKNHIIFFLIVLLSSCASTDPVCQAIYNNESLSTKTKTFLCGNGGYKYKCEKVGQCCEVGKDCEKVDKEKPKE